ncbi:hypothetical protein [Streptomyces sp. NPDC004285]
MLTTDTGLADERRTELVLRHVESWRNGDDGLEFRMSEEFKASMSDLVAVTRAMLRSEDDTSPVPQQRRWWRRAAA